MLSVVVHPRRATSGRLGAGFAQEHLAVRDVDLFVAGAGPAGATGATSGVNRQCVSHVEQWPLRGQKK